MIKRVLIALFCFCLVGPVSSNAGVLKITDTRGFQRVLEKHFPGDKATQARVADVYKKAKAKGGATFYENSMIGLPLDMCEAGGLVEITDLSNDPISKNIAQNAQVFGTNWGMIPVAEQEEEWDNRVVRATPKCKNFIEDVAWGATGLYYELCDVEDRSRIKGETKCERSFDEFNGQIASAVLMAQEWARLKNSYGAPDTIVCQNSYRQIDNDDYIKCKSINTRRYYEFQFDDVKESFDDTIHESIAAHIFWLHGIKDGKLNKYSVATKAKCEEIKKTAVKFGATVMYVDGQSWGAGCKIYFEEVSDVTKLKKDLGLDPFVFCKSIQIQTNLTLENYLSQYIEAQKGISASSIKCTAAGKSYKGAGCNYDSAVFDSGDDIVSCYVGDKQQDFVFDDINEWSDKRAQGGQQGMMCISTGGTFDSKNCSLVNKDTCYKLMQMNAEDCPECDGVEWDAENKMCVLKAAKFISNVDKATKIATVAGTAVAAVALTVFTGGAAAPGVWAIVSQVGTGLVVVGATAQVTAEVVMTYGVMEPFVKEVNKCYNSGDVACIAKIVEENLNEMLSYSKELNQAEAKAVDEIFVKLLTMIPDDDPFWTEFWGNPEYFDCPILNDLSTCVIKESAQTWQKVRSFGNYAMIAGGVLKMVASIGTAMQQTKSVVDAKVVTQNVKNGGSYNAVKINANSTHGRIASLKELGGLSHKEFIARNGLKIGDTFFLNSATGQLVTYSVAMPNLVGLVPMVVGAGNEIYHAADDTDFGYHRPDEAARTLIVDEPEIPKTKTPKTKIPETKTPKTKIPAVNSSVPVPELVWDDDIEIEDEEIIIEELKLDFSNDKLSVSKMPLQQTSKVQPHAVKDPRKTGLIATAAVLGAVGAGALIGGLVSNDKDDAKATNTSAGSKLEKDLETIMNNADRSLGVVNGSMIKLIPMATTNNTTAKIVNINGNAVAVVDYRGHNLPYYVNGTTGSWIPLLGIGKTGGWFNAYLSNTPPSVVEQVKNVLNQQLNPAIVAQFVGANSLGVQFPYAASDAYNVINAEFPNGVVETFNGVFSPADQTLYNNNYQRMLNLFNTAAHLGGFFVDIWV